MKLNQNYTVKFIYSSLLQGPFAKLQKRQLPSSCPSDRTEQQGTHWTDFHEIMTLSTFLKSVAKILFSIKYDPKKGYFT